MSEAVTEKRPANDVYDELTLKLSHIAALLEVMATCDKDQCDVNGAAYGLNYMVQDTRKLANEFYHARGAS